MKKGNLYRVFSMVLSVSLLFALVLASGCARQETGGSPAAETKTADKEYILIGRVNPSTGPLAGFGAGTPFVEQQAIDAVNKDGGIFIKEYNKKLPLKLIVADSESSSTRASEAANKLVLNDKVDILIASHTSETVNSVVAAAERNKIPCITTDAPVETVLAAGPFTWSFHTFWTIKTLTDANIDVLDEQETNKKVGIVFSNSIEGIAMSKDMAAALKARGYEVVDPGRFPVNTKDYTSLISKYKQENCDIILGNMMAPDFAVMIKQFHQQGYVPKMLVMGQAVLFASSVEALGELGNGVISEVWWSDLHPFKSSITGLTSAQLCESFSKETGKQPTPSVGYKHANIEILVDVLKRAQTLDRDKIREAIAATDMDTIVGHVKFNDQHYAETNVVMGQWVKGKNWPWEQTIISNKRGTEIPLSKEPVLFPMPGSTVK